MPSSDLKRGEKKDLVEEVHISRQAAYNTFKTKWEQMQENSQFLRLSQYSSGQLAKMEQQKRVPYVLDYLNAAMNTFQGIQRDRRTEIFYYPVESGDEVATEVLNAVKDATLSQNGFLYTESDIFLDGLVQKVGIVGYEWSLEKNKNGALKIFRIHPREVMWDLNAQEFDKTDATWVSRYRMFSKEELKVRLPQLAKQIDRMPFFNGGEISDLGLRHDYVESIADSKLGWVALIEHYKKVYETRFFIRNLSNGFVDQYYYENPKDADSEIRDRLQKFEAESQGQVETPEFKVFSDKYPVIQKVRVVHDMFIDSETLDEPFYPIDFYHPFWHDSDWWAPIDILKDGQRYHNKMFSMADHWIASMSKGLLLIDSHAPPDEVKKVREAFSTTGGAVQVKDIQNYKLFESQGPNPQLFSMLEIARQSMEDNSGGRNFMGKKETASESGIAVRQRIEQGGLAGFVVYDNLRRWKLSAGAKIAWYLTTYMTLPSVVRIEGEQLVQQTLQTFMGSEVGRDWFQVNPLRPGVGFLKVNTTKFNTIENLKVDVNVDEARWSISKNLSTLQEINAALQSNPLLAKVFPPEAMIEFMNLPFSVKQQALQRMQQLEQMNMMLEAAKVQKPPALSASLGDIEKLPPVGQAQLAEKFGIKLDPNQVEDPKQREALMKNAMLMQELEAKRQQQQLDLFAQRAKLGMDAEKMGLEIEHKARMNAMKEEETNA